MKKAILAIILPIFCLSLSAQESNGTGDAPKLNTYEVFLKGAYNSTWLFNKNISDLGDEMDYSNAWGYNYGLGFNMYIKGNAGFGVEFLMGTHTGGYTGAIDTKDMNGNVISTLNYDSKITLKQMQIPVMFKLKGENGGYLEVGPQFNLVQSADYNATTSANTAVDTTVTQYYSSSYFSAVVGGGFKINFGKESPMGMMVGLRLQYGFTDLKGVDGFGVALDNPFSYKTVAPTNAVTGGLHIAFVYTIK